MYIYYYRYMNVFIYIVQTPLIYSLALPPIEPSGGAHDDSCVLLLE